MHRQVSLERNTLRQKYKQVSLLEHNTLRQEYKQVSL